MKTRRELRRDLIGAVIGLTLSGAYLIGAHKIPRSSLIGKGVGADALPLGLAWVMATLALCLVVQTFMAWPKSVATDTSAKDIAARAHERQRHRRAAGMLLIGVAFLVVLNWVGYIVAVFAMICVTTVYCGRPMSWRVPALGAGLTAVLYVLFDQVLHIPMPSGIWPDLWSGIAG